MTLINEPGWDGVTWTRATATLAPLGPACWERWADLQPLGKANDDFAKLVFETHVNEMEATAFVFVTPRRWRKREAWRQSASDAAPWRKVQVFDADDLEAWLERAPAVTLWFASSCLVCRALESSQLTVSGSDGVASPDTN